MAMAHHFRDRDGRAYRLRPITPTDAPALQRAYAAMDASDKRASLFSPLPTLTDEAAAAFCTIDDDRDWCLVLEVDDEPAEIVGGCRLMGAATAAAEFSVWLRSDRKGNGLGRQLMAALLAEASVRGWRTVVGTVLADNAAMIHLARSLGFRIRRDPDDPEFVEATWQAAD